MDHRILVGVTGATGQVFGITALELLEERSDVETHLVLSDAAARNIDQEDERSVAAVRDLADHVYDNGNIGAAIASGSFPATGMLVAPCSMNSLSKIAHGTADNLLLRAAAVTLKERRNLVVMPMEKPFSRIGLENMLAVTDAGGVIIPPLLSYYTEGRSLDAMTRRTVARALSQTGLEMEYEAWEGQ
ncbi:MAG: UbiX family flavin prenyltransferase [Halodesulfurarchaeum sp.]